MTEIQDPFGWAGATIAEIFKVDRAVAQGGFGVVYQAQHRIFGERVAIKCLRLRPNVGAHEQREFYRLFLNEGRLLYRLSRDARAVVQPLHLGATRSPRGMYTPYLVLEWLDGETLADELHRRTVGWTLRDAVNALEPVAEALALAHELGIAHRDVKPQNLFLRRGRKHEMKILDFGVAKVMSHSAASTDERPSAYTLRYASPEQLDAKTFGPHGPWTDVYALALVLVEMLSGRPAYEGTAIRDVARQALGPARPTPRHRGVMVDAAIEEVFERALAIEPSHRFPDAGAFWRALPRWGNEGPPAVSSSGGPPPAGPTEPH